MRSLLASLVIVLLNTSGVWAQAESPKRIITPVRTDQSLALRDIVKTFRSPRVSDLPREIPLKPSPLKDRRARKPSKGPDPAWQKMQGTLQTNPPLLNFEGLSDADNETVNGFRVVPPDPNGDVGPNHYVQMVNLLTAVYDKAGNLLLGPFPNNALWDGFGGPCETDNDGDPIVLYDALADRWLLTQFAVSNGNSECVAISTTPDPTGTYFRYEFPFADFPDYPKLGVWPDAYYATFRSFGVTFDMIAAALERDKILVGDPTAQIVIFSITDALATTDIDGVLPVDLDGPPPPPGTPGLFLGHQDDASTGAAEDRLALFELSVDWDNTANSTLDGPFFLATEPFDTFFCGSPFPSGCIEQPFPGEPLDPISGFMMHRLAFRNFGTYMAMVANHTVDVGDFEDHAGIRWYELRNDGSGWSIFQQGTYAPDSENRWMGSIAMDANGNIGLGYSVSSSATFPSIRYAGRTAGAQPGEINIAEQSFIEGTGAQIDSGSRWGDYSMMAVDPTDDASFWYTTEYYSETSPVNWRTRVGAFLLEPLPGAQIQVLRTQVDFGVIFVGQTAGPTTVAITNIGDTDLVVSDISNIAAPFGLSNVPALPVTIPSFGSVSFEVSFSPTTEGEFSATISISSNDADDPVVDVALIGEGIDITNVDALVWNPADMLTQPEVVARATKKALTITEPEAGALLANNALSADEIAAALDANGVSNRILPIPLPTPLPANIQYLFVVLGHFPANYVIPDGGSEATAIEAFIAAGGHVYMEGGDTWFFDPLQLGGHDFGPTFGIMAIDDGADGGELNNILGSNLADGQDFSYTIGSDNYPDHLETREFSFLIHENDFPSFNCGIANPPGVSESANAGRTIGTSFEFGQLIDAAPPVTKTELMANYLDFFDNGFALEQGPQIAVSPASINFGLVDVDSTSTPVIITIHSVGSETLTISDISDPGAPFEVIEPIPLPSDLPGGNQDSFKVIFTPTSSGIVSSTITISSNDPDDATFDVTLTGEGFRINPAEPGICYATTGRSSNGLFLTIDPITGTGDLVGPTGLAAVPGLAINSSGQLFGTNEISGDLYRIDAVTGTAVFAASTGLFALQGIAFDDNDVLYGVDVDQNTFTFNLYTIDPGTGASTLIGPVSDLMAGLAFDPIENVLWGSAGGGASVPDGIYKIDPATGQTTLVGTTGLGGPTPDIHFDAAGNLFGVKGGGQGENVLIAIDRVTGSGTIIGAVGFSAISGLAFHPEQLEGPHIALSPRTINFGKFALGDTSLPKTIRLRSVGTEQVTITGISEPGNAFIVSALPTLPLTLQPTQSDTFLISFAATEAGVVTDSITVSSDDADEPTKDIILIGEAVPPPAPGTLFASTGSQGDSLITVDPRTGSGMAIGSTAGFGSISEIEFRDDGTLFASTGGGNSNIVTLDVITGTPTLVGSHIGGAINGLDFDKAGTLFGTYIQFPGSPSQLVTVNTETGQLTIIGATGFNNIGGLTFASDGTLYGATSGASGGNLITINPQTGTGTLVGATGFNDIAALEFGPDGTLYAGTGGNDLNPGSLLTIDPATGAGTLIGPSNFPVISGLSFVPLNPTVFADVVCPDHFYESCPISVDIQIDMSASLELLGSFTGTLTWDTSFVAYTGDSGIQSNFTGDVNSDNAAVGELIFNGVNPSGVGDEILILTADFEVIAPPGQSGSLDLTFSSMTAAITFTDLRDSLAVNDCHFTTEQSPFLLGDLNGDGEVNSTDALFCLSYDVELDIPQNVEDRINMGLGDVNRDSRTNSTDCAIMLAYDVGIPVPFPVGEPVCPDEISPTANFLITQNVTPAQLNERIKATAEPTNLNIGNGQILDVPVLVLLPGKERLGSFTAALTWNPAVLDFQGFTGGTTKGFENPVVNGSEVQDGKLTFAHAQPIGAAGSLNLLNVKFKAVGEPGATSALNLSFQTLTAAKTFSDLLSLLDSTDDNGAELDVVVIPETYALDQNYPNPFNPETKINYQLPEAGWVKISVYNLLGQRVRILVNREQQAGTYTVTWDGQDDRGQHVPSGLYFLRMQSGDFVADRKMLLIK